MENFYSYLIRRATEESRDICDNTVKTILSRVSADFVNELSDEWKILDKEVKTRIAITIGGRFHLNRTLSLLDSLSEQKNETNFEYKYKEKLSMAERQLDIRMSELESKISDLEYEVNTMKLEELRLEKEKLIKKLGGNCTINDLSK